MAQSARALRLVRSSPGGALGMAFLALLVAAALLAPWVAPHSPYTQRPDQVFLAPQFAGGPFFLGTDAFGRDVWSRLLWGARVSVGVASLAVALGSTTGGLLGLVTGYAGGRTDLWLQRGIDVLQALPGLALALALLAALGPGLHSAVIAIAAGFVATQARTVRSAVLATRELPYIEAARALGASEPRVLFRHVLPSCLTPFLVLATAELGVAVLTEATLSFLGLGLPPPEPSWGAMLGSAPETVRQAPWLALFPGVAISLTVFGANLLGDALRDALDPRLRNRPS